MGFEEHDPLKTILTGPDWESLSAPTTVSAYLGSQWHTLPIDARNRETGEVRVIQDRGDGTIRRFILDASHYRP